MKWFSAILTGGWGTTALLFLVVLSVLLHGVFLPDQTLFSNDGPLGELMAQCHSLPGRFAGCWADLNGIGFNVGAATPDISSGLQWLLGPVWFSKFYAVLSLWMLGLAAWLFFRQSGLSPSACVLGGGAMMLNSTFFSTACWGMSPHVIAAAMFLLALAALMNNSNSSRRLWLRLVLGGLAVGMGVAEGADVGAIFSLYVAVFMLYQAWTAEGSRTMNLVKGIGRLMLVVLCAVFLAAQPINALVDTSIKGVVGAGQDAQTKEQQWGWATQWSLPKLETLGLVVPGLFGYRLDTPDGGDYWGMIGRDPAWGKFLADDSQGATDGFLRYVGSGYYTGVLVVLVAFWAVAQSLRRKDSRFNIEHRKWLWFWLGVTVFSLLLALGRFAPFYRWFYAMPYASTIRNPDKFLYLFSLAVVVLFAFGVDGLSRKYMQPAGTNAGSRWAGLQSWWNKAAKFDKYWVYGCGLVVVASLLAWLDYSQHRQELDHYLLSVQFDPDDADSIASFSIDQVGWFILFFSLSAGLMVLIFSGAFAGKRAGRGVILLGLLLLADLGLANRPWIIYWNYKEKYASNPVIDVLRDKPYEHRVALPAVHLPPEQMTIHYLYKDEWLQQQFPFYNVQSFDIVEMSRLPEDVSALMKVLDDHTNVTDLAFLWSRLWQLTNTRYILGPADFWNFWNQQGNLAQTPLQTIMSFDTVPKPGISETTELDQLTAVPDTDGSFALFEFKAALPRAKLYDHWLINTNNPVVLNQLFSPDFNPESSVFVNGGVPANSATIGTNQTSGEVKFASYAPKDIILKAVASAPSVLLLNDHYDPDWKVLVDGKPERLLRCNSLMRGVYLLTGTHIVEFKFQPPIGLIYVSLAAIATGLLAISILVVSVNKNRIKTSNLSSPPPPPPANQSKGKPRIRKSSANISK